MRTSCQAVRSLGLGYMLLSGIAAAGQCSSTVSTFPYQEDFEAAPAWTSGGTASDWTWGTPSHPTINAAGEGTKGWFVGGLTGSFYSFGQQSWLESPCFDLSTLTYPHISFKLFWECERNYDGLGFQYSLDQGTTWSNLGGSNDPQDCLNANWFNTQNITALNLASPKSGWSGRTGNTVGSCAGGQGSGGWVTAAHCLTDLQGEPSVKFRFIFGAGTQCNGFDGIGVDLVRIVEAAPNAAAMAFECSGTTVQFQDASAHCPSAWAWDFGDPASGGSNTSTLAAPSHDFGAPGTYQVTLTVSGPCNAPSTVMVPITIVDLEVSTTPATCGQNVGTATAEVTGATGVLNYSWTPGGGSTQSINGLGPGTYTVNVTGAGVCAAQATGNVEAGTAGPALAVIATDVTCNGDADGTALVNVTGGSAPFTFSWAPAGGDDALATMLSAGTYTCTVSDAQQCSNTIEVQIEAPEPVTVTAMPDVSICAGASIELIAQGFGGTSGYTYLWSPEGPLVAPGTTTTYTVLVSDGNGCTGPSDEVTVTVGAVISPAFSISDTTGCAPLCVTFTELTGNNGTVSWDLGDGTVIDGAGTATHCYADAGHYDVTLTISEAGCSGSLTITDAVHALAVPIAAFAPTPQVTTLDSPAFVFNDLSVGATHWSWTFGDGSGATSEVPSPGYAYGEVGCFTVALEVSNEAGCQGSSATTVCVEDAFQLFAPNTFTPNNDAINDVFGVLTSVRDPAFFELRIHDRWGRERFVTEDHTAGWNAEDVPDGVYLWSVRILDTNGRLQERTGHVTVLR
ncbi:MAG: PKD domain-containing protein [Flavobacteriales bacterium]